MNLQSLVAVLLRLSAILVLIQGGAVFLRDVLPIIRFRPDAVTVEASMTISVLFLVIGGAVLIWVFSLPVARRVTHGLETGFSPGSLTLADCYTVIFAGVGLFYGVGNLASVLSWSHYILKASASAPGTAWTNEVGGYELFELYSRFIFGLVLFLNGRKWALALAARQQPESVEPPSPPPAE